MDSPVAELYAVAKTGACRCQTAWRRDARVIVSECRRCKALAAYEAVSGLEQCPRLGLELEVAK